MSPDPKTVREIATEHILDDARRAHDIGAAVLGHFGPDALTKHEYGAYCSAIREAIATATVAVSWPDEQQPADVVTAEQQQDGAAGRLAALLSHLDEISRRAQRARPGDTRTERQILADFVRQSVEPEQLREALRVVLAERTALAARIAELESEREADTRAVAAFQAASGQGINEIAAAGWAMVERFADRVAALDAGADGGAE